MRRMKAVSRCEVNGKVYLPGDELWANDQQREYLKTNGAAVDHPVTLHCTTPVLKPGATMEEFDRVYERTTGRKKPKKEKVK